MRVKEFWSLSSTSCLLIVLTVRVCRLVVSGLLSLSGLEFRGFRFRI